MRIISRDVSIAIIFTIIGALLGYGISVHFYQITKQESIKELKEELLQGALVDIRHNTLKENFPELYDSVAYSKVGIPRRKLVTIGIDRLYFNIFIFRDYKKFQELVTVVNTAKAVTEDFNERTALYNSCSLLAPMLRIPDLPSALNPGAYHYYQYIVRPRILVLRDYLQLNHQDLIR